MGKAFPSLQPPPRLRPGRVFRYPFERGTPPQRPRFMAAAGAAAVIAGSSLAGGSDVAGSTNPDAGPVAATVQYVIDGDTIRIAPILWHDQKTYVRVRFETISAPEIGARADCDQEAMLAEQAKNHLAREIGPGDTVYLFRARPGRYPGRLIAEVRSASGTMLATSLLRANLAVPFNPRRRPNWCAQ